MQFESNKRTHGTNLLAIVLVVTIISCILIGESMANKNKGEDIILYNGNIVLRGGKGKGKGGSIVVANSPHMDMMPFFDSWGGFGRKR